MIGQTISHYRITAKLGEGGMGVVYKAEDTKLRRDVAIKFLAPHLVRDEEGRKRFEREAMAAAALDHPNVCTVYEIDEADERTFIVMAFLEGRTLSKKIADGPLKLPEALSIAIQMADGLEAAHEKGVVHRDIKPDNVMLMKGSRGLVKLMDFGLAQLAQSSKLTREGTTLGTPIYMSPEQALGESTDKRADVWALGVVLYEMVAGQPPFRGERDQAVIFAIANEPHEPLTAVRTGVPKELERIVDKCLAKSAVERYQHVTDLLVDLQACRRSLDAQPGATLVPVPANRTPLFVGIAALVVAGLGLAWWLTRSPSPAPVPQYELTQVTRDTGYSADPALSPDGKLLAYSSDRDGDGVLDIWVRQLPGGQPTRLTDHEADDHTPSFSPDGTQIVFVSDRDGGGIYVVPVLGGGPRRIAGRGANPRFSPDGEWISYSIVSGVSSPTTGMFSQIELVSASGGSTRTVETDLAFAAHPVWSPDGKHLLFQGTREPAVFNSDAIDWWVVPVEGGEATELGISSLFEAMAIRSEGNPYTKPRPSVWLAGEDRVLFSAAIGDGGENIWQVRLAPGTFELGDLQRLTSGVGETMPSAAANGLLAFVSSTFDRDLWTLPLDANRAEVLGEPGRVLEASGDEHFPSISDDGRKLTYVSDRNGNWDLWLLDLDSNENEPLTMSPRDDIRGAISPDGKRIAFVRREAANNESNNLYVKDLPQGRETLLVESVGSMFGWMPSGQRVLYYTTAPLRYWIVDATTSRQTPVDLRHPDSTAHTLRFSPDESWIAFSLPKGDQVWLIYIAAVNEGKAVAHDQWIRITEDSLALWPWWAPDGNTLYFRSNRDGFLCIWAQSLSPTDKQPEGPLKAVMHFHGRLRVHFTDAGAMTDDRLYLTLSEPEANIYLAEPQRTE